MYRIYQMVNGDTIESIARKFQTSPEILKTINDFNNEPEVGSYIIVPKDESQFDKYIVMKGDSIYSIARNYGINPSQLLKLNGLNNSDIIYPGDIILIPKENIGFYITENNDTLNKVSSALNIPVNELSNQNDAIYLVKDQLIVYKK